MCESPEANRLVNVNSLRNLRETRMITPCASLSGKLFPLPLRAVTGLLLRLIPIFLLFSASVSAAETEILGVRMGMSKEALQDTLGKAGISVAELEPQKIIAPRLPVPLEGVREVRLSFEKNELKKIVIAFEIPPYEATANSLIGSYRKEQERLVQLFGAAAQDMAEPEPSRPEERYRWLARGGGYFRATWKIPQGLVTLWLYGQDDGLVFQEIYQSQ